MIYLINVGIDKYDPTFYNGDISLKQCVNDAYLIKRLVHYDEITELLNTDATADEVITTLKYYADKAQEGDTVIFYNSSHGAGLLTPKGFSTGRCCYDGIIWDWQLIDIWRLFKKGVLILSIADCCHSESINREVLPPGCKRKYTLAPLKSIPALMFPTVSKRRFQAAMISIAACRFDESSYELDGGGAFTGALGHVLEDDTPCSLRTLVKRVKGRMAPWLKQNPVIEYNGAGKSKLNYIL